MNNRHFPQEGKGAPGVTSPVRTPIANGKNGDRLAPMPRPYGDDPGSAGSPAGIKEQRP